MTHHTLACHMLRLSSFDHPEYTECEYLIPDNNMPLLMIIKHNDKQLNSANLLALVTRSSATAEIARVTPFMVIEGH